MINLLSNFFQYVLDFFERIIGMLFGGISTVYQSLNFVLSLLDFFTVFTATDGLHMPNYAIMGIPLVFGGAVIRIIIELL